MLRDGAEGEHLERDDCSGSLVGGGSVCLGAIRGTRDVAEARSEALKAWVEDGSGRRFRYVGLIIRHLGRQLYMSQVVC